MERIVYKLPKVDKFSKSEARWRQEVWIGSIGATDEHLIGTSVTLRPPYSSRFLSSWGLAFSTLVTAIQSELACLDRDEAWS